jgi:hypothetical protein
MTRLTESAVLAALGMCGTLHALPTFILKARVFSAGIGPGVVVRTQPSQYTEPCFDYDVTLVDWCMGVRIYRRWAAGLEATLLHWSPVIVENTNPRGPLSIPLPAVGVFVAQCPRTGRWDAELVKFARLRAMLETDRNGRVENMVVHAGIGAGLNRWFVFSPEIELHSTYISLGTRDAGKETLSAGLILRLGLLGGWRELTIAQARQGEPRTHD